MVRALTYTVQNFLMRHRALRRDDRYLAYVVEEASYMLKHPAGRTYLETGSRGFQKTRYRSVHALAGATGIPGRGAGRAEQRRNGFLPGHAA